MLSHLWWGWVFLINVPVVLIGLAAVALLVPASRATVPPDLDVPGMVASAGGLAVLTYGLVVAGEHGWTHPTALAAMAVGLVALAGFLWWERHTARSGRWPLIDPALFRSRSFTWGAVLGGLAGLGMIGLLFVMPQYFQAVDGANAFDSGLRLLPLVGGLVIGAAPSGVLVKTLGAKYTVAAGFVVLGAGSLAGAATDAHSSATFIAVWMAVMCAGTGLALSAATAAALSRLSAEASGVGSAVVQAFQKTAGPVGTAVIGSVVAAAYAGVLHLPTLAAGEGDAVRHSVYDGVAVARALHSATLARHVQAAFAHGVDVSLLVSVAIAAVGIIAVIVFLPHTEHSTDHAGQKGNPRHMNTTPDSGTGVPRPGLRERKKAKTRASIQHHAMRLFRRDGYDATTVDAIIDAAEVSESTFFRYFPTKEAVVLSDDYDPLLAAALRAQPADATPGEALRAAFRDTFTALDDRQRADLRGRITLVSQVPALRAAMLHEFSQAMELLAAVIAERTGRPSGDFAVRTVAGAVIGVMIAVFAELTDHPDADILHLIDAGLDQIHDGLAL